MENQIELKWYQKSTAVIILLIFFFPVGLYLMWKNELWTKKTRWIATGVVAVMVIANTGNNNSGVSNSTPSSEISEGCSGNGDRSCINKIRTNFKNSGKDIIGEQYDGDGIFQIQFIDYGRGSFNAYVRMDCECEIAHINITSL